MSHSQCIRAYALLGVAGDEEACCASQASATQAHLRLRIYVLGQLPDDAHHVRQELPVAAAGGQGLIT